MKLILTFLLASSFSMSVAAQTAATSPADAAVKTEMASDAASESAASGSSEDAGRVVCKREKVTGSRTEKRVCQTAETAKVLRESSQEFTKKGQGTLRGE